MDTFFYNSNLSMYNKILIIYFYILMANIPDGYYDSTEGLIGENLKLSLYQIINDHNSQNYNSLHQYFETTDRKFNNTVWDMYSDNPNGNPNYIYHFIDSDQCGNYSSEGDCYNKEHSWPKSWFNNASPMNSDLFHLYPTDGYVNSHRGNYPYGEVGNATWISTNGSKKGTSSYPGYNGIVFEPINLYKGDFARTYFYMSTRYYNEDASWDNTDMTNGAELKPWAINMLIDWHLTDPVSNKELNRNEEIYLIQGNRNPFIDHPEWVECVWAECNLSIQSNQKKQNHTQINSYNKNNSIILEINLEKIENIKIDIFNIQGKHITKLFSGISQTGLNRFQFHYQNHPTGIYFIKINYSDQSISKKFIIYK